MLTIYTYLGYSSSICSTEENELGIYMTKRKRLVVQSPKPVLKLSIDANLHKSDFTYQICCINTSGQDVTVVFRDNLPVTYSRSPVTEVGPKQFIIRKTYTFTNYVRISEVATNLHTILSVKDNISSEDIQLVYKVLMEQLRINKFTTVANVHIDREINLGLLSEQGFAYVSDLDLMLFDGRFSVDMVHPNSIKSKSQELFNDVTASSDGLSMTIEMVDNENVVSTRYMYLANKVVEIPSIKDPERPSGVYKTDNNYGKVNTTFCTLDEMGERLGIQPTIEDAITAGDPEILHKSRLKELERATNISKIEQQQEATESKRRMLQLQEETETRMTDLKRSYDELASRLKRDSEELKVQNEEQTIRLKREHEEQMLQLKRESERQKLQYEEELRAIEHKRHQAKDYWEERSYDRKDSSEGLKTIGILAAGALSIFALMKK